MKMLMTANSIIKTCARETWNRLQFSASHCISPLEGKRVVLDLLLQYRDQISHTPTTGIELYSPPVG